MADGDLRKYEGETESEAETEGGTGTNSDAKPALVWDLPVRVFHWTLVIAIIAAYVTNKLGVAYFKYHVWCGYTVLVLIGFRVIWGFVGTRHARFFNFIRGPKTIWRYVRGQKKHWAGHNPLGALMVIVLLVGLFVQAASGLFGNDEIFNVGPLYGYVSNELSLRLTSLHRQLFYWIAGAIGLHIAAVVAYRVFKKEKLIEAMFSGRKPSISADEAIHSSHTYLAIAIGVVVSAFLTWLIMTAPVAVSDLSSY